MAAKPVLCAKHKQRKQGGGNQKSHEPNPSEECADRNCGCKTKCGKNAKRYAQYFQNGSPNGKIFLYCIILEKKTQHIVVQKKMQKKSEKFYEK